MANPWESEPSYIKTGGLQHILDVNKRFSTYERSNQFDLENHSSIEFIENLKLIASLNEEQSKATLELHLLTMKQEFHNVLNTTVLDGLISMVEFLTKHLQQIIDNKEILIQRLHQPFVGEHLAIDSSHHEDVISFFPSVSENLSDLSAMLQNIEWINKFSFKRSDLHHSLEVIQQSILATQNVYQGINETRELMQNLMNQEKRT